MKRFQISIMTAAVLLYTSMAGFWVLMIPGVLAAVVLEVWEDGLWWIGATVALAGFIIVVISVFLIEHADLRDED